jgi:hypothetical protein
MLDEQELEKQIRDTIIEICEVMYRRGYSLVSVGAVMRLVGVDPEQASEHDDELFELSTEFEHMLERRKISDRAPPGATVH